MKKFLPLSQKVFIVFIFVLLSILAIFYVNYLNNKKHIETLLLQDLRTLADDREGDLLLFIEMNKTRIMDFASDQYIKNEVERLAKKGGSADSLSGYLRDYKLSMDKYLYRLSIISPEGRIMASTVRSNIGKDVSGEEFFYNGLKDTSVHERIKGYLGKPELAISTPILDGSGKPIGVLAGYILTSDLGKLFSGIVSRDLGAVSWDIIKGRRTMEIYLVNGDKQIIATSRSDEDKPLGRSVGTEPVRVCLERGEELTDFYTNYAGEEVAGASMCFPSKKWTLLVEIGREEVLKPLSDTIKYTLVSVIAVVLFVSVLVVFFLRFVVNQLRGLARASRRIAEGDYSIIVPVKTRDEIGVLSESFNVMTKEIKGRESALRESEGRFRAIMDNATNVIYLKDIEGRYILINRRYEELFKIKDEEIKGKTDFDLFPSEIAAQFRRNDINALEAKRPVESVEKVPQADGEHTYLSIKVGLMNGEGRPYAICGISTDITQIMRSEEALRMSEASLANAQRIAHIGNWDWDIVKNELWWSDEVYRIFGEEPRKFGATFDAFLCYVHPEDAEKVKSEVNEALYNKKPYSMDHRILTYGKEKIVHEQGEVTFDGDGKPVRMSGTVQDITERKRAEEEVKRLNEELEERVRLRTAELDEANRDLEAFSYSVAHDLKTPLRLINGFSRALYDDYSHKLEPQGQDYLKRLQNASLRMSEIIDDLLTLSRITRAEMKTGKVDLSKIASEVFTELKRISPGRDVEFVIEDGLSAEGDATLLRIALDNLIGNAWKFTGKKTNPVIEFRAGGTEEGKKIFMLRDNGAGFNMEYSERLFMPFQRLHSEDDFPGTGIGLATVQRIIKRHGGRIWAEGEQGKGAAFYFTLKGR